MATPREHRLVVSRSARYYTIEPSAAGSQPAPPEVWIVLHGYGQLAARFIRRFEPLTAAGLRVVAPEALNRYYLDARPGPHGPASPVGATWMTREDREAEIADYVAYLDQLRSRVVPDGARCVLLGFSQGAATAVRAAVLGARAPDRLIVWGTAPPPDLDAARVAERLSQTDVVLVAGAADDHYGPAVAEAQAARLAGAGVRCDVVAFAGGHVIDAVVLGKLAAREWR